MKKTKLIFSVIMAAVMICVSVVPAFAIATSDESPVDLQNEKTKLREYVYDTKYNYFPIPAGGGVWYSIESIDRLFGVAEKIENECHDYTTQEEIDEAYRVFNDALSKMHIDEDEIKWMLEYMEKDYNSTGYYDNETTEKIKSVCEETQRVYNNAEEENMQNAYIEICNLLNEVCVYNTVPGDVNKSGSLNIVDVALMQLELAQLNKESFNSSQRYVAGFNRKTDITCVANWQLAIAKLNDGSIITDVKKNIDNLSAAGKISSDNEEQFVNEIERMNNMYYVDRYYENEC